MSSLQFCLVGVITLHTALLAFSEQLAVAGGSSSNSRGSLHVDSNCSFAFDELLRSPGLGKEDSEAAQDLT